MNIRYNIYVIVTTLFSWFHHFHLIISTFPIFLTLPSHCSINPSPISSQRRHRDLHRYTRVNPSNPRPLVNSYTSIAATLTWYWAKNTPLVLCIRILLLMNFVKHNGSLTFSTSVVKRYITEIPCACIGSSGSKVGGCEEVHHGDTVCPYWEFGVKGRRLWRYNGDTVCLYWEFGVKSRRLWRYNGDTVCLYWEFGVKGRRSWRYNGDTVCLYWEFGVKGRRYIVKT